MNDARRCSFDATGIRAAPAASGAYRLYHGGQVIFVGMASGGATIRSELQRHWRGETDKQLLCATEFDWDALADPLDAYRRYLAWYMSCC